MSLGLSGSRYGATENQEKYFRKFLKKHHRLIKEFHHGDCEGWDSLSHEIIREEYPEIKIIIHPPKSKKWRGMNKGDQEREKKDYLERNKDIVQESDLILAFPKDKNMKGSGTWHTINYARRNKKRVIVRF
jgi:hypothetical protein